MIEFAEKMKQIQEEAEVTLKRAQKKIKRQVDKKRREVKV